MNYSFTDIDSTSFSKGMSIQTIVDGINLDVMLPGYRTLKVDGREMVSRDIATSNHKSVNAGGKRQTSRSFKDINFASNGNRFLGSTLADREIIITFRLTGSDNYDMRRKFEKLNYIINKEQIELKFTDDLKYHYIATLSTVAEVDNSSNSIVSRFAYACSDPFKYTEDQVFSITKNGIFNRRSMYPIVVDKILIEALESASELKIRNKTTEEYIRIMRPISSGDKVEINLLEGSMIRGSENLMPYHDIFSDLEEFSIKLGDEIECNINAKINFIYRIGVL